MARRRASMREGPLAELFKATEAAQRQAEREARGEEPAPAQPTIGEDGASEDAKPPLAAAPEPAEQAPERAEAVPDELPAAAEPVPAAPEPASAARTPAAIAS